MTYKTTPEYPDYQFYPDGSVSYRGRIKTSNRRHPTIVVVSREGRRVSYTPSRVMREFFPYDWIKYLYDDEEVTPINGLSGYYITTYGRVWSDKHWRFMSPSRSKNDYYYRQNFYINGGIKTHTIHSLVGRYFLPDYRDGLCILHRDETLSYPEINHVSNLWVGTQSENIQDMWDKNRHYLN